MPEPQLKLSEVIDVRIAGPAQPGAPSTTLVKTATLEVWRLTLSKGREIPTHQARGEITVHCLEGRPRSPSPRTSAEPPRRIVPSGLRVRPKELLSTRLQPSGPSGIPRWKGRRRRSRENRPRRCSSRSGPRTRSSQKSVRISWACATVRFLLFSSSPPHASAPSPGLLAGHAEPRTTRLYDRRRRKVTRYIFEHVSIEIGRE
jgi:hypothetical protein